MVISTASTTFATATTTTTMEAVAGLAIMSNGAISTRNNNNVYWPRLVGNCQSTNVIKTGGLRL